MCIRDRGGSKCLWETEVLIHTNKKLHIPPHHQVMGGNPCSRSMGPVHQHGLPWHLAAECWTDRSASRPVTRDDPQHWTLPPQSQTRVAPSAEFHLWRCATDWVWICEQVMKNKEVLSVFCFVCLFALEWSEGCYNFSSSFPVPTTNAVYIITDGIY